MPRSSTIALCALGATTVDAFAPSVLRSTRVTPLASTETEEWSAPAMPSSDGAATDAVPEEVAAVQSAPRTSLALPFMNAPKTLDGTLAGDMVSVALSSFVLLPVRPLFRPTRTDRPTDGMTE
jgi:hypothetical protein